ncbi:uncharacterized protein LOC110977652 [Acanthaster planci]|uniref:Uncharacterized protein LOC110977652 n=1 Tax=Acanthaster planci TaxID=133434 RepID=A0A8B7Y784_ACAPL|nr:uncharacterized protein LOC110977652 [Acanthaster planci]
MPADFSGKWVSSGKQEGWVAFLAKFNIPIDKIPPDIKVTEEITQSGNTITIKTTNNKDDKVKEVTITVGTNHKDTVAPGVEMEFTTAWEGDKLVLKKVGGSGGSTRELVGNEMVVTLDADGTIAKSYYDKV